MFDIGASELLLIVIVAIVVIGPKDMPLALRTAGRWIARIRRVSGHFRSGIEAMIREAEMEENEKRWREHNARIMAEHADTEAQSAELPAETPAVSAEARTQSGQPPADEPQLPLGGPPPPP